MSGNPRNKFSGFKDGKHGTEIFGPHPELPKQMVAWYIDTLVKHPADPKAPVTVKNTPAREFWQKAASPTGVSAAVQLFYETRQRDPRAVLFPEAQLNLLGYVHLQAGRTAQAVRLFRLNTLAYPMSANTYDSLGDAYLANGQNELALRASEKALELLAKDAGTRTARRRFATAPSRRSRSSREARRTSEPPRPPGRLDSRPGQRAALAITGGPGDQDEEKLLVSPDPPDPPVELTGHRITRPRLRAPGCRKPTARYSLALLSQMPSNALRERARGSVARTSSCTICPERLG